MECKAVTDRKHCCPRPRLPPDAGQPVRERGAGTDGPRRVDRLRTAHRRTPASKGATAPEHQDEPIEVQTEHYGDINRLQLGIVPEA